MSVQLREHSTTITDMHRLRGQLQAIERMHSQIRKPWICPIGFVQIDHDLPEHGLPSHAVHAVNGPASLGFLLHLIKNLPEHETIFWCRSAKAVEVPYGPAFLQYDVNPETILFVQCHNMKDMLWSYEEALKSNAVKLAIIEPEKPINLIESRRLQLAAEIGGSLGILLSPDPNNISTANALFSRWHITSLPQKNGYHIELQRIRGHAPKTWQVEAVI